MSSEIFKKKNCRVCKSKDLERVLDFGMTPLANNYLTLKELDKEEKYYPLKVMRCKSCGNLQLEHVVNPELMFKNYLYASSTSHVFVKHFDDFALSVGKKDFVVDIGGNDGILLKPFQELGSRVLNIDPAENIKTNVPTIHEFFTTETAKFILEKHGKADLVTACNVFAHADDLDEITEGVKMILSDNSDFVIEVADVEQMFKDGTFDLIYHEHVNYWSMECFIKFFNLRGMYVSNVEKIPTHGGSLRIYARVRK